MSTGQRLHGACSKLMRIEIAAAIRAKAGRANPGLSQEGPPPDPKCKYHEAVVDPAPRPPSPSASRRSRRASPALTVGGTRRSESERYVRPEAESQANASESRREPYFATSFALPRSLYVVTTIRVTVSLIPTRFARSFTTKSLSIR